MVHSSPLSKQSRISSLDYLRGLAAFGILLYHYQSWIFGNFDAGSFWGRVGIYGVAIFYVLSGLTLYHVYEDRLRPEAQPIADFYIKRLFRLFPLLWVVFTVYLIREPNLPDWWDIFLNYTGLFSLLDWDKAIGVGVWSIGNELTFYLLFPFFIFLGRYNRIALSLFGCVTVAVACYFAFQKIDPNISLAKQWRDYTNPLNQVFLFFGGFAIGYFTKAKRYNTLALASALLAAILLFIFLPFSGETAVLVAQGNRFLLAGLCMLICFSIYKLPVQFPAPINILLVKLGEISYALYLLHPIVYNELVKAKVDAVVASPLLFMLLATIVSVISSLFIFQFYERPFIRLGQKVSRFVASRF
ncbi:acyltransferase [Pontibacter sp. SGAir0037]|uniref:acyltransferase family protein n=1 Tax=Pontibacter sp. SGAir0037 TaxID=2571030 RepID=UPI00143D8193|nr:acyltransferase [Pontibacter sp. SGAir0037]